MLFVLIPIVWLTIIMLCWVACAMAQHGDAEPWMSADRIAPGGGAAGLIVWEDLPALTVRDARRAVRSVR